MNTYIDCGECNVCLHGECYACMVGVATGPESHDTCCGASSVRFDRDMNPVQRVGPAVHRVHVELLTGDPVRWDCWCGEQGLCRPGQVRAASDAHINYMAGETRTDTVGLPDPWGAS